MCTEIGARRYYCKDYLKVTSLSGHRCVLTRNSIVYSQATRSSGSWRHASRVRTLPSQQRRVHLAHRTETTRRRSRLSPERRPTRRRQPLRSSPPFSLRQATTADGVGRPDHETISVIQNSYSPTESQSYGCNLQWRLSAPRPVSGEYNGVMRSRPSVPSASDHSEMKNGRLVVGLGERPEVASRAATRCCVEPGKSRQ